MRRRNILMWMAAGPAANALSLANFQSITSSLVPLTCLLTYDSQIPSCTVSDFNDGCSASCVAGLNSVAKSVSDACSNVQVNSNTLLAIVQDGGIVEALCPALAKTSTTSTKSTKSVTIPSSTPAAPATVSVTIPTDGPGVTGGLGFKTSTSTSSSTSKPQAQSASTTTKSMAAATSSPSTTSQLEPADGGLGGGTTSTSTTTTSKKTTTTSSQTTASPKSQSQDGKSGGGSPFDTASNDAPHNVGRSMMALVVAICAVLVIGR